MEKMTLKQMFQVSHALGIDLFNAGLSHLLKHKVLPVEFYRNRFQTEFDATFEELVQMEYAIKTRWQDLPFYQVTEKGIEQYRIQFSELVKYRKPIDRDLPYLKNRINFYCEYRMYRFCDDNSDHIIHAYLNYWVKKYRVSHTTEDVMLRFNNELRQAYRKGLLT